MQKIFLNYDQQIAKLEEEKNLVIKDKEYAKEILKQTSYYSLIGGYKDILKIRQLKNIRMERPLKI